MTVVEMTTITKERRRTGDRHRDPPRRSERPEGWEGDDRQRNGRREGGNIQRRQMGLDIKSISEDGKELESVTHEKQNQNHIRMRSQRGPSKGQGASHRGVGGIGHEDHKVVMWFMNSY